MKSFVKILAASAAALQMLVSCNFLDEVPTTNLVTENVYANVESAETALNGCYKTLFTISQSSFVGGVQNASLLQFNCVSTKQDSWYAHTLYSTNSTNSSFYQSVYKAISTINTFIAGVTESDLPEESKASMTGEARFLRAFWYFFATRLWGDLPLLLDATTTIESASVPRSSYMEVYKAILDDLTYAEKNCLSYDKLGTEGIQDGRVCNYAATALKAKVYAQIACYVQYPDDQWFDSTKEGRYPDFSACGIAMYDAKAAWQKALDCAEDVMQNGPFSLEPDYANLFRWDPENHPEDYLSRERILAIPITTKVTSCSYSSWSLPKQPWGAQQYTTDNGNKLKIRPSRFTWEKWCERYADESLFYKEGNQGDIGTYHYWSGCPDPRIDASYYSTVYYTGGPDDASPTTNYCYPYAASEDSANKNYVAFAMGANLSSGTGSLILGSTMIYKKGFSKAYRGSGSGGDADVYLMRYADVILLAAEAAASLGDKDKAVLYVNRILRRARMSTNTNETYPHVYDGVSETDAPADWTVSEFADTDDMLLAIQWERVFEMDYEFQSMFDLRRRGANYYVDNFVKPFNDFMHEPANIRLFESGYNNSRDKETEIARVRAGLLLAFPDRELRYNTALGYSAQNDFYIE